MKNIKGKGKGIVITVMLVVATCSFFLVSGDEYQPQAYTLLDSYSESNVDCYAVLVENNPDIGQTFKTPNGTRYYLKQAKFYIDKDGVPSGNLTAVLYNTSYNGTYYNVTGSPLATSDVVANSALGTAPHLRAFNFTGVEQYYMQMNHTYAIIVNMTDFSHYDVNNETKIGADSSSPTHNGTEVSYYCGNWTVWSASDVAFYVYGDTTSDDWLYHKMHFPQEPDPFGWDVCAITIDDVSILADDWRCNGTGFVTDIHFWISWLDDFEAFEMLSPINVSIYSDNPFGEHGYSTPNESLWNKPFLLGEYNVSEALLGDQGWYEAIEGWNETHNHINYYRIDFENITYPFYQINQTIYWLVIEFPYIPGGVYAGWKTSLDHWNDAAVYRDRFDWINLSDPLTGESLDFAFVISEEHNVSNETRDWADHKMHYPQLPDPNGWDVNLEQTYVGDDWQCNGTGNVSDIHFWISWAGDAVDEISVINCSIWSNNVSGPSGYSIPEEMLWTANFSTFNVSGPWIGLQGFMWDPWTNETENHMQYYRIDIENISDPFYQENGTIYWLVITMPETFSETSPGWKTSNSIQFMDGAVWSDYPGDWFNISDPITHEILDLAFVITGELEYNISVDKTVWNGTDWVKEYEDATAGETLNFNISIHNCGVNSNHNITVWDTYYDGLRYVPGSAYITYANGTRVQRDPDWNNWEKGDCEYVDHGHLGWNLCGNETANFTYCSYIYIEYNLTLNNNNYTKNEVFIFVCNNTCGCMWEDVLLENSSYCYVGQQFANITCNCTNSPESSNWSVSEHINRDCTGSDCLDEEWFEYETDFNRWCPYNTSTFLDEDWAWVYRYDNWDGNGTDDYGLSWTIANESCINRSQSIVRMRVEVNDSLEPGEPWAIPFVGVIYSYTNNSEWDAVMYSYEVSETGKPIVALLSKHGDYLYNTNDSTLVLDWFNAYNYWELDWSCNQTDRLDEDLDAESPSGIWAKTIYNEYCGRVQAKAWQGSPAPYCFDSMGMCQEPSGWIYDNLMTNVENENATCFGLVVWNPLVQIGEEEFTRLDFYADFDFIEEWRLNYSFDEWATTAQKEAHCSEMNGNIPYQYLPCFDCVEYDRQELAFAEIVREWEMQNITNLTFYDASACHYRNISNHVYDTSRSHRPIVDCLNEYMWDNQNDTIYYRTTIGTNNSDEPDMLHFHIEDATDGTNDSADGCVICIDVDNDQVWGNNDLCFFWTDFGNNYTVWNGTQVFSNSSQPEFDGVFTVAFDECMYSQAVASLQPLHRYGPHRQYSLSIPLCLLQKDYFGSYNLLEAGDMIGLHMQTINSAETLIVPSISPVWENWNETACNFLIVPEDAPYLTWGTYMNISNEPDLENFWINEIWNGTSATQMQYWGQARIGDEYPLSNPWSINVTKESDIIKITDTSKNTTVVFNVTVCNNGTAPVTDVVVNDTFPFCCEYINSSLPVGNVSGNYTFNVTGVLDVDDCITFNITVNFTANCVVPNGTILNNIVYAFSAEGANVTDSYGIQYGNNTAPVINWQYPINGSINVPLLLANISVNVSDADNDLMSIYFYTNKSNDTWYSEWNAIGVNLSVANGTYQCNQTFNNSQTENTRWRWGNTTYHWYVNVTDGKIWTNVSYSFTTEGSRYDINTDNWVDGSDLLLDYAFRTGVKSYYGIYDVNGDDWVDGSDLLQIYANRT